MRLRNQIPQLWRANICRLHKHRVYSTEHNAANDGAFFVSFFFFLNVQIQANVKKITPLYNLSPLVMSPISVLLEFRGWHMFVVVFFLEGWHIFPSNISDVSSGTRCFWVKNDHFGSRMAVAHQQWQSRNKVEGGRERMRETHDCFVLN